MRRKLQIWLSGAAGALLLVYGCHNMAREMSCGEMLYRAKCSSCHNVIAPKDHDPEEWHLYVERYGREMTDEEKGTVLHYLTGGG
jgi:cytochrome c5